MISVNLTLENPAVLPVIEKLLAGIQGITKTVVDENDFDDEIPNAATRAAIEELETGGGFVCNTLDELIEQLNS
jgi:hypothetical protein